MTLHYVRFLPPREKGCGEIVHVFSSNRQFTLKEVLKERPDVFDRVGFYTLAIATGETLETLQ